jgi:hypothetical protein
MDKFNKWFNDNYKSKLKHFSLFTKCKTAYEAGLAEAELTISLQGEIIKILKAAKSDQLLERAFNEGYSHGLDDGHPLGKSASGGDWAKSELFESIKELT